MLESFIVLVLGLMFGLIGVVAFLIAPKLIPTQFAFCSRCRIAKFDKKWDLLPSLTCDNCQSSMQLIITPEDLFYKRVKTLRIITFLFIPTGAISLLGFIGIWIPLIAMIVIIALLLITGYKLDNRVKKEIKERY